MRRIKSRPILNLIAVVVTLAVVTSLSVSANPGGGTVIRRGLVTGDIAARSAAGDAPNINDALEILRSIIGLPGIIQSDGTFTVAGGGGACTACPGLQSELSTATANLTAAQAARTVAETDRDFWKKMYEDYTCGVCGQGTPVCTNCTSLQALLSQANTDLENAKIREQNAIAEANSLRAQLAPWQNHVCESGSGTLDSQGQSSGPIPAHAPRSAIEDEDTSRARITDAAQNVVHVHFMTGRPNDDGTPGPGQATLGGVGGISQIGPTGHWVRFNEVAEDGEIIPRNRLTIRRGGTYVLSGTLPSGGIFVNAFDRPYRDRNPATPRVQEPVVLILNGVTISNNDGPAIHGRRAETLTIVVQDGTNNTLSDGATYLALADITDVDAAPEPSAVIFSQRDIILRGHGALTLNSHLSEMRWRRTGGPQGTGPNSATTQSLIQGRGIESRDKVFLRGGNITVNALDTAVHGRDGVTVSGGTYNLNSVHNNGIRSNNATTSNPAVDNNTLGNIVISNGVLNFNVKDDALSAERRLSVTGGSISAVNPNAGAGD
ncbi:MAG: carbohydrate-binding domain-containing protein [Oscillospiraceae bacterium]|nr:carbohydrate-binding domain-containing protein [Oscillospiraceae bacterium]